MNVIFRQAVTAAIPFSYGNFVHSSICRKTLLSLNVIIGHQCSAIHRLNGRSFTWATWPIAVSNSAPVALFQESLLNFHELSSLPWWSIIFLSTIAIRSCVTFPLAVYQHHIVARLENVRKEMKNIGPELMKEVAVAAKIYKWDSKYSKAMFRKNMHRHYTRLVIEENCHPFKGVILILFQVPIWICFSFSLRNMVYMTPIEGMTTQLNYLDLKTGGFWWFTDLTIPDGFFIPILLAAVNLTLIEMNALRRLGNKSLLQKISVNTMRLVTVTVAVAASFNPSAVTFYWLCSSTFGLGQNVLLLMPKVRRVLRIPQTPSESATPFRDIYKNFRTALSK